MAALQYCHFPVLLFFSTVIFHYNCHFPVSPPKHCMVVKMVVFLTISKMQHTQVRRVGKAQLEAQLSQPPQVALRFKFLF